MNFMVGSNITEGMNTLTLTCTYTDASGAEHSEDTMVYILNVVNDGGTVGRPRLIISNFSTVPDPEKGDLRAGSQFEFVLEIENTHSSVSARNIKVTLSQAENIFTVSEGSSSIFISSIAPGETSTNTFRMKVKNDATTKAYPLEITIQYDYDGKKLFVKGALDRILERCDSIIVGEEKIPLNENRKKEILKVNSNMCSEALRVLAFAYKDGDDTKEENLTF